MALRALQGPAGGSAPVGGSGTPNTIPRWTGATTLGDSIITQTGTSRITIGSGSYAGASLDGVRLVNGVNSYFTASDGTRTSILGADGSAFVGTLTTHDFQLRANNSVAATIQASTGNVGIGTAGPGSRLEVVGAPSQPAARLQVSNTNTSPALNAEPGLNLLNTVNSNGVYTSITNRDASSNPNAQINFINVNQSGSGAINFVTRDSVGGGFGERVRIDNSGNVGIGTSSPSAKLEIAGGTSATGVYLTSANGTATVLRMLQAGQRDWGLRIPASDTALTFYDYSAGAERARIDNSGNIYGTSGTTGMTNGFFYIPAAAGAPTGTPTAVSGRVPMYYDTTNNNFYVYNGAWKKVLLA